MGSWRPRSYGPSGPPSRRKRSAAQRPSSSCSTGWRSPLRSSRWRRWPSARLDTAPASSPPWSCLAGYLGLTALFETVGPKALVIPHFIRDTGFQRDRAQGPFLEATVNGVALYTCAVASAIAVATWTTRRRRIAAGAVLLLCTLGLLFTLTRSVWIATVVASALTMAFTPHLRRFLLPAVAGSALVVLVLLTLVPKLDASVTKRANNQLTVWERRNVDAAALEMVSRRPLLGFGLGTFNDRNAEYFPLLSDVPQVVTVHTTQIAIHNVFLLFAVEQGLVGVDAPAGEPARRRGQRHARPRPTRAEAMARGSARDRGLLGRGGQLRAAGPGPAQHDRLALGGHRARGLDPGGESWGHGALQRARSVDRVSRNAARRISTPRSRLNSSITRVPPRRAEPPTQGAVARQPLDSRRQLLGPPGGNQQAGGAVLDQLRDPHRVRGDHREPAGQGLHQDDGDPLAEAGQAEGVRRAVVLPDPVLPHRRRRR